MNNILDRLPVTPRLCFNWLPTYRYGLFAYKALQQTGAMLLKNGSRGWELGSVAESKGMQKPLNSVRPIAIDSLLRTSDHHGYIDWQFTDALEQFSDGKPYYAVTEDVALIVTKEDKEKDLLNNVIPYMTSAPTTLTASLAIAGGYAGVKEARGARGLVHPNFFGSQLWWRSMKSGSLENCFEY